MADYNINSGNLTSLGTDGADNFYFRTGGNPNVVVNALAGNDSVYIQSAQAATESAFDGLFLSLQGGADYLLASGTFGSNSVGTSSTIRAGAGGDTLRLDTETLDLSAYQVFLGDGSDSFAATLSAVGNTTFNAGSGADTVTVAADDIYSGSVLLGSGADRLTLVASAVDAVLTELGGGADNGNFDISDASAVTINGGAGADTITYSGLTIDRSVLGGDDGDDLITFSAGTAANVSFQGGAGADRLNFVTNNVDLGASVSIVGGAGKDSIYFSGASLEIGTGAQLIGGAGNDTINIANIAAAETNALFVSYNAASESNFNTFDRIIASANQTAIINTRNLALQSVANGTYAWGSIQDGVALFTSGSPTVAEAMDLLDDVLNIGQAVAFSVQGTDPFGNNLNNNSFIFIQAGNIQNSPQIDDYLIMTNQVNKTSVAAVDGTTVLNVKYS